MVVMMLTPDELQSDIYREQLAPSLKEGAALLFAAWPFDPISISSSRARTLTC